MPPLPSRVIGVALSTGAFLLAVGSYLGQPKSPAPSPLEIGFSALQENPAQSPDRSIQAFRSALALDPASPFRWCDLGEAYLLAGDPEKARVCYLRASVLGPRMPSIQLRLCNYQIRTGDASNAAACLAELLRNAPAYRGMILSYYEQLGISPAELVGNGDFEEPIGDSAYNWKAEGSGIERDSEDSFSGKWSLRIPASPASISQTIFLLPGVYKLELFTKSDGGKNGLSVQVSLIGPEDSARFAFHSKPFEIVSKWRAAACTFTVPPGTRLLSLRLEAAKALTPATVRLDRISITPVGSKAP